MKRKLFLLSLFSIPALSLLPGCDDDKDMITEDYDFTNMSVAEIKNIIIGKWQALTKESTFSKVDITPLGRYIEITDKRYVDEIRLTGERSEYEISDWVKSTSFCTLVDQVNPEKGVRLGSITDRLLLILNEEDDGYSTALYCQKCK